MALRLWIVGSGTLRPNPKRGGPAFWLEGGGSSLLMDCGPGSLRTLSLLGLPWQETTHIVLSHFHTDHVADLAPLLFALRHGLDGPRSDPLHLLGPPGLREHVRWLSKAHGGYVTDPGFPVVVEELEPGVIWSRPGGGVLIRAYRTRHTEDSLAFRVEWGECVLGYTGDTGPDPGLGAFLRGCRVLLAECSFPDGEGMEIHLTPADLASLAAMADPDLLISVHAYPPLDPEAVPDLLRRAGYGGRAVAGRDGMRVMLEGQSVTVEDRGDGSLVYPSPPKEGKCQAVP